MPARPAKGRVKREHGAQLLASWEAMKADRTTPAMRVVRAAVYRQGRVGDVKALAAACALTVPKTERTLQQLADRGYLDA